jgi:hypothetical protein
MGAVLFVGGEVGDMFVNFLKKFIFIPLTNHNNNNAHQEKITRPHSRPTPRSSQAPWSEKHLRQEKVCPSGGRQSSQGKEKYRKTLQVGASQKDAQSRSSHKETRSQTIQCSSYTEDV